MEDITLGTLYMNRQKRQAWRKAAIMEMSYVFSFAFTNESLVVAQAQKNSLNPTFTLWGLAGRCRKGVYVTKAYMTCIKGIALDSGTPRVYPCSLVVSCVTGQWLKIPWLQFCFCFFFLTIYWGWTPYSPRLLPGLKFSDLFIRVLLANIHVVFGAYG